MPDSAELPLQPAPPARSEARYARAFSRVARILLGADAAARLGEPGHLDPDVVQLTAAAAHRLAAESQLADALTAGRSLEAGVVATVRGQLDASAWHRARALVEGVSRLPGGTRASRLGLVLAAHRRGWTGLAWASMAELDDADLASHLPVEAVETALRVADPAAGRRARDIASSTDGLTDETLIDLSARFLAVGDSAAASSLAATAAARDPAHLDPVHQATLAEVQRWLRTARASPSPDGAVSIGLLDYHQLDRSRGGADPGDYVQALALLGNLARFTDCSFTGGDGLGDAATAMQARVGADQRLPGIGGSVHLAAVNRDFSLADDLPPRTWTVVYGSHGHSLFGLRHAFPYHSNVRPVFVSFSVGRPALLTDEAVQYLRRYGPVGCRDWATVDLLLSAGVDAFFTGCLSTTVDTVLPARDEVPRDLEPVIALVDVPAGSVPKPQRPVEHVALGRPAHEQLGLAAGMDAASASLAKAQRRYHRIVTSRLTTYLSAISLGIPVRFSPRDPSDPRWEGLTGLRPDGDRLVAMRDGIRDLLAGVLGPILDGAGEDDVYARWRELTADRVASARARLHRPAPDPALTFDVDAAAVAVRAVSRRYGPPDDAPKPATDVALSLDQNLRAQLPVTLEALTRNATGPLRLWITTRGLGEEYERWLSDAFPHVPMTFLPCDGVEYGDITRMISRITVTTMDRLMLPILLDVDRVTYIDIDAVVLGDVCELARTDLGTTALAARTSDNSAVDVWRRAGSLLSPDRAAELRRRMAARDRFDVATLNAGILVLDLARMRADRFTQTYLPWVERYGLNDQDVLLAYAGGRRTELAPRWNAWPVMEVLDDPAIVHYLGALKPWSPELCPGQDSWREYEDAFRARVGSPPG